MAEIKYAATCDVSTYSFIQNRRFASVAALPLRECMFTHVHRVKATKCTSVCALENAFIHFSGLDHNIVKPGPPCQNSYRRAVSSALTNMTSAHLMASAFAFAFYSYHNLLLFAYFYFQPPQSFFGSAGWTGGHRSLEACLPAPLSDASGGREINQCLCSVW